MRSEALAHAYGTRWYRNDGTAHCPLHRDREPALSIKDGADGRDLLHCPAGWVCRDVYVTVQRILRGIRALIECGTSR